MYVVSHREKSSGLISGIYRQFNKVCTESFGKLIESVTVNPTLQ